MTTNQAVPVVPTVQKSRSWTDCNLVMTQCWELAIELMTKHDGGQRKPVYVQHFGGTPEKPVILTFYFQGNDTPLLLGRTGMNLTAFGWGNVPEMAVVESDDEARNAFYEQILEPVLGNLIAELNVLSHPQRVATILRGVSDRFDRNKNNRERTPRKATEDHA